MVHRNLLQYEQNIFSRNNTFHHTWRNQMATLPPKSCKTDSNECEYFILLQVLASIGSKPIQNNGQHNLHSRPSYSWWYIINNNDDKWQWNVNEETNTLFPPILKGFNLTSWNCVFFYVFIIMVVIIVTFNRWWHSTLFFSWVNNKRTGGRPSEILPSGNHSFVLRAIWICFRAI